MDVGKEKMKRDRDRDTERQREGEIDRQTDRHTDRDLFSCEYFVQHLNLSSEKTNFLLSYSIL